MFISGYADAEFSDLLEGDEPEHHLPAQAARSIKVLAARVKQQLQAAA